MLYQPVSQWHSLHFELLIELVAQKLTELWRFKNLAYFLTWWPSSMTYLFVNITYWNCSPIPYVDQVWWWYVKAFMSYAWQNWQTNRQTDRQTDKPTNEHTCQNCKFWQVMTNQHTSRWGIILRSTVRTYDISWFSLLLLLQNGSQTDPRFRFAQKTASEKVFSSILAANKCCQSTAGYVSFETK